MKTIWICLAFFLVGLTGASAAETASTGNGAMFSGTVIAAVGALAAVVISGYGTSKGLDISGNTAAAAIGENDKNFSSILIMEAMPQTQVIYGFIIATLIVLGIMGKELTLDQGYIALAAGLTVGITGLSAINQGSVASASIGATQKNPDAKGKAMIFIVLPEIAALFGFVIAILFLIGGKIL